MLVDTAPPPREPSANAPDRDSYTYATSSVSFGTVLTEVNDKGMPRDAVAASSNTVELDSKSIEDTAAPDLDETTEPETSESPGLEETASPTSDDTKASLKAPLDEAPEYPQESSEPVETLGEDIVATTESAYEATSPEENMVPTGKDLEPPENLTAAIISPLVAENMPAENMPAENTVVKSPSAEKNSEKSPKTTESTVVLESLSTSSIKGEETPPNTELSSKPPFPKTLNALLAENAVKPQNADAPASPLSETSIATTEKSSELDGMPDTPPPALPQTSATELGGIRTTTPASIPRVPLTNLPGEIAQQIHLLQQQGTSTIRLRLSPENLGELRLEVQHTGNTVRVTLISASPQVRDALDSQMTVLRQALAKQGLNLAESFIGNSPSPGGNGGSAPEPRKGTPSSIDMAPMETRILKSNPQLQAATTHATSGLNVLA